MFTLPGGRQQYPPLVGRALQACSVASASKFGSHRLLAHMIFLGVYVSGGTQQAPLLDGWLPFASAMAVYDWPGGCDRD
jgi:hypothetical protein